MNLIDKITIFLISLLRKRNGRFSRGVFFAVSSVFGESCLELCIFRRNKNKIELFLIPRSSDDPFWAGLLHVPGIRKLPADTDTSQLARVVSETDFVIDVKKIRYAGSSTVKNERGTEFADVRFTEVPFSKHGGFYDVKHLPENVIPFQKQLIELGIKAYLNEKK